jgi:hypothetical protein
MCEEDSEDHEAVAKLFEINDSIHRTIERYKLFKKGDIEAANNIPQGTLGRSGAGVSQGPNNTLNLIDFGDPEPASQAANSSQAPQQPAAKGNALEDDLLGLSLSGDTYGQSGSISLGGSNGSGMSLRLITRVHSLNAISSRNVWNGRPATASPAKTIHTIHYRSVLIRSEADNTPTNISPSIWLLPAYFTASSHVRSFRIPRFHTPASLALPISTVRQTTTTRVRCRRSSRWYYICALNQSCAKYQRGERRRRVELCFLRPRFLQRTHRYQYQRQRPFQHVKRNGHDPANPITHIEQHAIADLRVYSTSRCIEGKLHQSDEIEVHRLTYDRAHNSSLNLNPASILGLTRSLVLRRTFG